MHSIMGFIEARNAKAAEQRSRDVEAASLRRDLFGPSYKASTRRKDIKVLREDRPAPLMDKQGQPLPPVTDSEIGDGFRSKQKKKALPKYNATRPFGSR